MRSLAGIANTKVPKGPMTAFGAFCGKKLQEANNGAILVIVTWSQVLTIFSGKEKGKMITLPNILKTRSCELKTEFSALSNEEKNVLLAGYEEAKDEKENNPMRASNVAISKAVDSKMQSITAMACLYYYHLNMALILLQCEDLNRMYRTETLVLFCRGNLAHSYSCGSFATEGAQNWLENSDVGHSVMNLAAMQMEAFMVSGCNKRVNTLKGGMCCIHILSNHTQRITSGTAKLMHRKVRSECRNTIQARLSMWHCIFDSFGV